ncbi:hypothetical protein PF004_g27010 [Phytophthora fragariae]|uniref:Uncharacterized protein n=1 Tax=Phytophthora fragariae TaxID=53985 RepID=A0A6G0MM17_9STRA|nr:hypothetical protein PF004_g27010 [Phytophthora fragariae]
MFAVEKSFRQIWRELSKQGWKYKKPAGLSNDNRCLPPTGYAKGTEGVDFFARQVCLAIVGVKAG